MCSYTLAEIWFSVRSLEAKELKSKFDSVWEDNFSIINIKFYQAQFCKGI